MVYHNLVLTYLSSLILNHVLSYNLHINHTTIISTLQMCYALPLHFLCLCLCCVLCLECPSPSAVLWIPVLTLRLFQMSPPLQKLPCFSWQNWSVTPLFARMVRSYFYCEVFYIVIIYMHVWLTCMILGGRDHGLLKGVLPSLVHNG